MHFIKYGISKLLCKIKPHNVKDKKLIDKGIGLLTENRVGMNR